ncbi:MAG TPA: hypothetical protein VEK56_05355 [Vicinamibacterales bacterium]|nr:hypothetical protein [Vicinamibacterales bacterium]
MPDVHIGEEELILHYYGESAAGSRAEAHLAECARCRAALADLTRVLALVDTQPLPEPLDGLEQRVWARVQPEIQSRRAPWFAGIFERTPRWVVAGAIGAVVLSAFIAGRLTTPASAPSPVQAANTSFPAGYADRILVIAVGDHLDQSQMVLLELLNADATRVANIEDEQIRARDLVAANRLYRQTALQAGDEGVGEVLDALERVLLEIANAPSHASARDLEGLRADIAARGILFRVRVVASEMRAREQRTFNNGT